MKNRIIMTESTKASVKQALGLDIEALTEEELLQKLRASKQFVVTLKENGTYKVKQVLKG